MKYYKIIQIGAHTIKKIFATPLTDERKGATNFTTAINNELKNSLIADSITVEASLAKQGLLNPKKDLVIPIAEKEINAWDMTQYDFLTEDLPDTVNAKLWEHAKHNLNKLLPEDSAKKYVEYMGGADKVLQAAMEDYQKGEYQWVAEVTKQIIFADPDNEQARFLCADALEQLGYIAESGPWRNEYLFAAQELRHGVQLPVSSIVLKTDVYDAMDMKHIAGMIAIRLNGEAAAKENYTFSIEATDSNKHGTFHLRNGVLVYLGKGIPESFHVKMSKRTLYMLATGASGKLEYTVYPASQTARFDAFVKLLDTPDIFFNIVTP